MTSCYLSDQFVRLPQQFSCCFVATKATVARVKRNYIGVLMCFQFERKMPGNTNFLHSRLLVNAILDRQTYILMRGKAGRSCNRQIK